MRNCTNLEGNSREKKRRVANWWKAYAEFLKSGRKGFYFIPLEVWDERGQKCLGLVNQSEGVVR